MTESPYVREGNGISVKVHVQPRASKSEFCGIYDGYLKIRIAAAPVEGEANKEVIAFLAQFFRVSKSSVNIKQGLSSRRKIVLIEGDVVKLEERLRPELERN